MGKFPLVRKKEKYVLTWPGRLLVLLLLFLLVLLYIRQVDNFLSPNKPVFGKVLIVEGFMPDYAMEETIQLFQAGDYEHLLITGKKRLKGAHLDHFSNDGDYSAATLLALGFDSTRLSVAVMSDSIKKDRTYSSALAAKAWLWEHHPEVESVDLVSLGCHARRSLYLFRKAFGGYPELGVYSITDQSFEPTHWWNNSHGFREINKETIAWVYARFFFRP